ncbi:MAG: hypothetical protein V7L04_13245 [Nostoc sp.]|uniref:hypothetical protein n=1 Tax=Nostoc sp. TaxID=1180 RepID=UPI002FF75EE6
MMTVSKFEQLKNLVSQDYKNTYLYVDESFRFIETIYKKTAEYLGCQLNNISFLTSENGLIPLGYHFRDAISIDKEGFFGFQLLIKLEDEGFNINNCGRSFADKNLLPPSGIVLYISIQKIDANVYSVVTPHLEKDEIGSKKFTINTYENLSYAEFLESCFNVMEKILEGGLNERSRRLSLESNSVNKVAFGFQLPLSE